MDDIIALHHDIIETRPERLLIRGSGALHQDEKKHTSVKISSKFDRILKEHLDKDTVFKEQFKTFQKEILESMLEDVINESNFLAVQCDKKTDV